MAQLIAKYTAHNIILYGIINITFLSGLTNTGTGGQNFVLKV